jgi:hypothetical protein
MLSRDAAYSWCHLTVTGPDGSEAVFVERYQDIEGTQNRRVVVAVPEFILGQARHAGDLTVTVHGDKDATVRRLATVGAHQTLESAVVQVESQDER